MAFNLGDALRGVSELGTGREQIEYIRLELIDEDPNNFYNLSGIDELAANIELCGLQQPIRVRPIPDTDRYMIVSGHRRRKAVEMLAAEDADRWNEIPCIVQRDSVSPALQQLRLIYANANTRTMTPAETSEQAEQVEKLLYQLKEEGYEFPGRMRDHVAQAVGKSKSKLARLKVIRENLAADWRPSWKNGTLVENTAYELSKMPKAYQSLLFEEKSRTNANLKYLYADDVKKFAERAAAIVKQTCQSCGGECANYENKLRKAAVSERYGWFYCDNECCKDCPELTRCQRACSKLKDLVKTLKADAKEAKKQELLAKAKKDKPAVDKISALWQRFGHCREMAYKDFDACKKAMGIYYFPYDEEKSMKLECGEAKISPETKLPFGYNMYLSEVTRLVALADLFDCSLDYLFCRTDVKEMAREGVQASEDGADEPPASCVWHPVSEIPPVGKKLILLDYHDFADEAVYRGDGRYSGRLDDEEPIRAWTTIPTDEDLARKPADVSQPSGFWRDGHPDECGTYAVYVQMNGTSKAVLREMVWTGSKWLMYGQGISDLATVCCWADRPEV